MIVRSPYLPAAPGPLMGSQQPRLGDDTQAPPIDCALLSTAEEQPPTKRLSVSTMLQMGALTALTAAGTLSGLSGSLLPDTPAAAAPVAAQPARLTSLP